MKFDVNNVPQSQSSCCTRRRSARGAFTLVELLVVIGIIAILLGILLPTITGARRSAYTVQCSSNMKQLATAMIMYIQDNKGKFPVAASDEVAGITPAGGYWWPDTLVTGNYIKGSNLNVYKKTPSNVNDKVFSGNSPFRCPEGIPEEFGKLSGNGQGDYPTNLSNNAYQIHNDSQRAAAGFGVPSWYMLASRVQTGSNSALGMPKSGNKVAPFMYLNNAVGDPTSADYVGAPAWQRNLSMVRRSAEMVMMVEAATPNWMDQSASNAFPNIKLPRLGARHGKKTKDGANARTNLAFFDGHIGLYDTEPFTRDAKTNPGKDNALVDQYSETIFYLNKQRGK
jgi:prepilin-type N-terminal cleavage/methylation domain-containing protein/prepilin-type processing-associated H-X9-DG protein